MKHALCPLLLFLFAVGTNGQTKADEEAVRRLPQAFSNAWAKHDGHELARIMIDDVDFVTVGDDFPRRQGRLREVPRAIAGAGASSSPASRR